MFEVEYHNYIIRQETHPFHSLIGVGLHSFRIIFKAVNFRFVFNENYIITRNVCMCSHMHI